MGETRKSFLLRMPPDLWEQINRLAQSDLRSVNAEIEFLLREAVKKRHRGTEARGHEGKAGSREDEVERGGGGESAG